MDIYQNFEDLCKTEKENIDFRVVISRQTHSNILIIAPHGGCIEPGTSEIAKEVAGADFSLALFEGIKPKDNKRLHITSTHFDEPRCMALVQASDTVVSVHGEKSSGCAVYIGGSDRKLKKDIQSVLNQYGYTVHTQKNHDLPGVSPKNICNRGRHGKGVQLEISAGLRKTFFQPLPAKGPKIITPRLVKFSSAIRDGLIASGRFHKK